MVVVLGGAPNVWDDKRRLEEMAGGSWPGPVIVLNDVGVHYPGRVDYWLSLHPEELAESDQFHPEGWPWIRQRAENGHPDGYTTISNRRPDLVHEVVLHWGGGSVGFYAPAVCYYHLGQIPAVLCGCPLDDSGAFEESTVEHTVAEHLTRYRRGWTRRLDRGGEIEAYLRRRVRSMSGWTMELLGAPDAAWLSEAGVLPGQQQSA